MKLFESLSQKLTDIQELDHPALSFERAITILFESVSEHHCVLTSSLGIEDQLLSYLLKDKKLTVVVLDTGRLHEETYSLLQTSFYAFSNFTYHICYPNTQEVEKMLRDYGPNLFYESIQKRKLCCEIRKITPLKHFFNQNKTKKEPFQVWITGLRREQSSNRSNIPLIEYDSQFNIMKFNPLYNWTKEDVWNYAKANPVPYNPLHTQGYPSIGCEPCTRAINEETDHPRSGRWWWESSSTQECGLHN